MMFQMCGQKDSVSQLVNMTTIPSSVLCGCEAWSVMQSKETNLWVTGNTMLLRIWD